MMLDVFRKRLSGDDDQRIVELPIHLIAPNPNQPRKYFDNIALTELARSIMEYGVIQPITVREKDGAYELISGERRLRASQLAGFGTIPAIIVEADAGKSAILALLENLQREDLCFFEIAQSYRNLIRDQGITQEELARRVGKSQDTIANKIRLLKLPARVKKLIRDYGLSERHARAVLSLTDESSQLRAVKAIHKEHLSVQQAESLVAEMLNSLPKNQQNVKITSLKDVRVFTNTVRRAVDMMKKSGVEANMQQSEHDWGVEYIIRVKNMPENLDVDDFDAVN